MPPRSAALDPAAADRAAREADQVEAWVASGKVKYCAPGFAAPSQAAKVAVDEPLSLEAQETVERIAADQARAAELEQEAEERAAEQLRLRVSAKRNHALMIEAAIRQRRPLAHSDTAATQQVIDELGAYERAGFRVDRGSSSAPRDPKRAALWAILITGLKVPRTVFGINKLLARELSQLRRSESCENACDAQFGRGASHGPETETD